MPEKSRHGVVLTHQVPPSLPGSAIPSLFPSFEQRQHRSKLFSLHSEVLPFLYFVVNHVNLS